MSRQPARWGRRGASMLMVLCLGAVLLALCASLLTAAAQLSAPAGQLLAGEQARQLALRFDAAPSYGLEHHKFITLQRDAAAYDDFGPTAMEGVEAQLKDNESDYPGLWALWEEVCHEEA